MHDVTLRGVPALLLFAWSLPLKGLENLVMVLVRGEAQAEIEAGTRHDSHQTWNGRLPATRFVGSHDGLGDTESVGQLPLRESRLESSREYEAAGDGRALQEMWCHVAEYNRLSIR